MTVVRRLALAALIAAFAAPAGVAQETPKGFQLPPAILVARSWDEAIKEATIRNVPILFTTALAT
ncbi:MAG TPA: hypothetical protein VFS19_05635 [Planctomycetota bacterium]|nr:hypothetical protein [Planctomycetota bacterium]